MRVFTIHLRPSALTPDRDALLIKEGFCWPAFFFGPFWALWHRMWFAAAGIFSVLIGLGLAETVLRLDPMTSSAVMFGVSAIIGFCGNDWHRNALAARGWNMRGLSAAPDRDLAFRRFVDLHPDVMDLRPLAPAVPAGPPPGQARP
jgi:hypothetical protein